MRSIKHSLILTLILVLAAPAFAQRPCSKLLAGKSGRQLHEKMRQMAENILLSFQATTGGRANSVWFPVSQVIEDLARLPLSSGMTPQAWSAMSRRAQKHFVLHAVLVTRPISGVDDREYEFTAEILHITDQSDL